jgi:hypothetical protein
VVSEVMMDSVRNGEDISGALINFCLSVVTERQKKTFAVESTAIELLFNNQKFIGETLPRSKFFLKTQNYNDYKTILIPLILGRGHWTLCCVDVESKKINHFDSLKSAIDPNQILDEVAKFLNYWSEAPNQYEIQNKQCPRQKRNDCGACLIKNAIAYLQSPNEEIVYEVENIREEIMEMVNNAPGQWVEVQGYTPDGEVEYINSSSPSISRTPS